MKGDPTRGETITCPRCDERIEPKRVPQGFERPDDIVKIHYRCPTPDCGFRHEELVDARFAPDP